MIACQNQQDTKISEPLRCEVEEEENKSSSSRIGTGKSLVNINFSFM